MRTLQNQLREEKERSNRLHEDLRDYVIQNDNQKLELRKLQKELVTAFADFKEKEIVWQKKETLYKEEINDLKNEIEKLIAKLGDLKQEIVEKNTLKELTQKQKTIIEEYEKSLQDSQNFNQELEQKVIQSKEIYEKVFF